MTVERRGNSWTRYLAARGQAIREELIRQLGGRCVYCRSRHRLELDHKNGRDWNPKDKNQHQRAIIYRREAAEGKLQVLCKKCNSGKRDTPDRLERERRAIDVPLARAAGGVA